MLISIVWELSRRLVQKFNLRFFPSLILENSIDRNWLKIFEGNERWFGQVPFVVSQVFRFVLRSVHSRVDFRCLMLWCICFWFFFLHLFIKFVHFECERRATNLSHQANESKLNFTNMRRWRLAIKHQKKLPTLFCHLLQIIFFWSSLLWNSKFHSNAFETVLCPLIVYTTSQEQLNISFSLIFSHQVQKITRYLMVNSCRVQTFVPSTLCSRI